MKHRAGNVAPLGDQGVALHEHVDRQAQSTKSPAQADHLGVPRGDTRLDHHEVQNAVCSRVVARMGAEEDHAHRRAGGVGKPSPASSITSTETIG
jgi:hypothetical protein